MNYAEEYHNTTAKDLSVIHTDLNQLCVELSHLQKETQELMIEVKLDMGQEQIEQEVIS